MEVLTLDAHTHCGYTVPFQELAREWEVGGIDGGVIFSPVEEIYDRYDPYFRDSERYRKSRRSVHDYLLKVALKGNIFPYFFVWNDFSPIPGQFVGIKWHRHPGEPIYNYEEPACERVITEICRRELPVVLEEEYGNTLKFLKRISERTVVIIPHLGALNGGYNRLKLAGIFESPKVWVDTALAGQGEIVDFANEFGTDRIMFGSDYPFGTPASEKRKILDLFSGEELKALLSGNLLSLLDRGHE